ncbi:hypothetical protein E2C01_083703 [Portunus trituberculatus]|uniref:Uncharacterized protein n=1 Tax=Portunus trituberculatus TaxID=210409 RepID=A0A5B7IXV6_PORTR|nr:hypothetical protein [Portunus trituberculatus]
MCLKEAAVPPCSGTYI